MAQPQRQRLGAFGAGPLGDPALIDDLIGLMELPTLSRVAGEAFSMITGLSLAYHNLDGPPPEGYEAGPSESPDDQDVGLDSDEDLPWPIAALVANWWF